MYEYVRLNVKLLYIRLLFPAEAPASLEIISFSYDEFTAEAKASAE